MKFLLSFLPIFFLSIQVILAAQPAHRCDGCSQSLQFEGVALQNANSPLSTHYVYSLPNEILKRYEVHRQCQGDDPWAGPGQLRDGVGPVIFCAGGYQYQIYESNIEADVQHFFQDMVAAWQAYGESFHAYLHLDFPGDFQGGHSVGYVRDASPTAYTFINNGTFRGELIGQLNSIIDGQNNPHTLRKLLSDDVEFQGGVIRFALSNGVSIRSRVRFDDGSAVHVRVVDNSRAEYIPRTAIDANGTLIPDYGYNPHVVTNGQPGEPGPLYGGWNPSDLQGWMEAAQSAGIPITQGGGGGAYIISCSYSAGSLIECTINQE